MGSHLLGSEEEPYYDEICSALGRFLSCSSGEFSSPEKTEPEREHKVLHGEQRHRLSSLGGRTWGWHSILCQPGVQPVQGRQPRRHQGRQQGNKHQVLPWEQQPRWKRPGRLPRRLRHCGRHPQSSWKSVRINKFALSKNISESQNWSNNLVGFLGGFRTDAVTITHIVFFDSPCGENVIYFDYN